MMKQFKVTLDYRGKVTVQVEAADEKAAEQEAIKQGDDSIGANISVYDAKIEEI